MLKTRVSKEEIRDLQNFLQSKRKNALQESSDSEDYQAFYSHYFPVKEYPQGGQPVVDLQERAGYRGIAVPCEYYALCLKYAAYLNGLSDAEGEAEVDGEDGE